MLNLEFVCLLSEACAAVSNNCVETEPLTVEKKKIHIYLIGLQYRPQHDCLRAF